VWVETLAAWVTDLGMDSFVFWPDDPTEQQVRAFAKDVVPQVRQRVESERSRTPART
jgi:hypothetical protein